MLSFRYGLSVAAKRGGRPHADAERDGQRSGSQVSLLASAIDDRLDAVLQVAPYHERTDALWSVHLVRRKADEVSDFRNHLQVHCTRCLSSIAMKNRAVGAARSRYCVYVVDRADFIVYCHHGHHQHVVAHHSFERVWIDVAPRIDWDVFDLEGELISKRAARSQNALMFGLAEENPASVSSARSSCQSQEGEVVGFGRTRGEDDLVGVCTEELPDLLPPRASTTIERVAPALVVLMIIAMLLTVILSLTS